ncbi:sulfotransferase domain-containing protein [Francisella philomiragia]|uniref:sulfotransferase domain-containing protein n=1 Tax=Francisella philomiragia TaxID=28110 RepID=UPI001904CCF3|nr:sulfotransferase domain-containing protein [Francisella philomiragia]MBK2267741.1 sulfotransferase domain-containing protein [Francisella philomiragia]MBK2308134.1 sulfotransferase domain-containing protein [Francisella philomiragia]
MEHKKRVLAVFFDYLNKLDGFKGSNIKEIHYFSIDDRFKKNKDWYLSHFSSDTNQRTFEATPFYLYHPESPSRIFNSIKTSKFIVLLRNPAERAYSHWNMFRSSHRDIDKKKRFLDQAIKGSYFYNLMMEAKFPSFKDSINEDLLKYHEKISDINPGYVRRGLYYEQLQNYLKYYNIKNFLFVDFEDLTNNIPKVLKQVLDFLDIGEHEGEKLLANLNMAEINISNKGKYESQCEDDKETLEYLREFYKPHNEKLFNLIGKRFDW